MALEEVALDAVCEGGRLVARTSARQVAERLGIDPGTAAGALRDLRRQGLLVLERESGPSGRFGLSVYVLGSINGLKVVPPSAAPPCVGLPSVEKSCAVDSDSVAPDRSGPSSAGPRAATPCAVQPVRHTSDTEKVMETSVLPAKLRADQCPGQTALDLGSGSS
jgi:hypothetical protein